MSELSQAQRRRVIVERARADGRIDAHDLAARLDVAIETIRRDLTALAQHGVLRRIHGAAYPAEGAAHEVPRITAPASWSSNAAASPPPPPKLVTPPPCSSTRATPANSSLNDAPPLGRPGL